MSFLRFSELMLAMGFCPLLVSWLRSLFVAWRRFAHLTGADVVLFTIGGLDSGPGGGAARPPPLDPALDVAFRGPRHADGARVHVLDDAAARGGVRPGAYV